jgi:hypothetical protein
MIKNTAQGRYRVCLPRVSMGRISMLKNAAMNKPPEAYMGAFGFEPPACMATIGAQSPATRLRKLDIPVPVPRIGAGKTSGV